MEEISYAEVDKALKKFRPFLVRDGGTMNLSKSHKTVS